jgi:hypothetical protein
MCAGTYFVLVFLCILLHLMLILMVEKLSLMSRRHRLIQVGRPSTWSTVRLVGYSGYAQGECLSESMGPCDLIQIHLLVPLDLRAQWAGNRYSSPSRALRC